MDNLNRFNQFTTRLFLLLFEVALLFRMIILYSLLDSRFDSFLFSLVAFLGVVVLFGNVLNWWKNRIIPNVWLMLIIFAMIVSTILTPHASLLGNGKMIIWQIIYFFVVFEVGRKKDRQLLKWFENILMVFWTVATILSLLLFFMKYTYTAPSEKIYYGIRIGMVQNRLYGIFVEPNFASNLSAIVSVLMVKRMIDHSRRVPLVAFILGLLIQFTYIVLSGSRSAILDLSIVIFITLFIATYGSNKRVVLIKRFAHSILLGLVAVVIFIGAGQVAKQILPHLVVPTELTFLDNLSRQDKDKNTDSEVSLEREDISDDLSNSNGRLELWKSASEIFLSRPITGGSPRSWILYARENLPKTYIAHMGQTPHNFILLSLVSTGLLGTVPLLIFLILRAWELIKLLFNTNGYRDLDKILCIMIPVQMVMFACLMPDLIFENRIGAMCFWLFLGWTTLNNKSIPNRGDKYINESINVN